MISSARSSGSADSTASSSFRAASPSRSPDFCSISCSVCRVSRHSSTELTASMPARHASITAAGSTVPACSISLSSFGPRRVTRAPLRYSLISSVVRSGSGDRRYMVSKRLAAVTLRTSASIAFFRYITARLSPSVNSLPSRASAISDSSVGLAALPFWPSCSPSSSSSPSLSIRCARSKTCTSSGSKCLRAKLR